MRTESFDEFINSLRYEETRTDFDDLNLFGRNYEILINEAVALDFNDEMWDSIDEVR